MSWITALTWLGSLAAGAVIGLTLVRSRPRTGRTAGGERLLERRQRRHDRRLPPHGEGGMIRSKLVRDEIPRLTEQNGSGTLKAVRRLEGAEYLGALLSKLMEEANELRLNPSVDELADVAEVVSALTLELTTPEHLEAVRQAKADARGSFADRVWMTWEEG
jgi:predicted house-cleaning noncanonical NTP pyrophosphatase (MazG superfamily)